MRVSYNTECLWVVILDARVRNNGILEAKVLLRRVEAIEVTRYKDKASMILDTIILHWITISDGDNKRASIRCGVFLNIDCLERLEGGKVTYMSVTTNHLD